MSVLVEAIKTQITNRIKDKNLTIESLEKLAGLNKTAVRSIFIGKSKNPTIETLVAISDALNCSVDELIEGKYSNKKLNSDIKLDPKLFIDIVLYTIEKLSQNNDITFSDFLYLVTESYEFCVEKKEFDTKFIDWLIKHKS